jgi:copper chaperone CopZ
MRPISPDCNNHVILLKRLVGDASGMSSIPIRNGMITLVHDVPGRLRLVAPHVRHDRRAAAALRRRVRAMGGVASATVNPLTGSVIVHYDGAGCTRDRILHSLGVATPGPAMRSAPAAAAASRAPILLPAPAPRSGTIAPQGKAIAEMIANAVAERLVERAVRMAVAALI